MYRISTRLPVALAAVGMIATLAGCGGPGHDSVTSKTVSDAGAETLVHEATQAAAAASSVTIRGKAERNGRSFTYTTKIVNGKGESDDLTVGGNGTMKYIGTQDNGFIQMTGTGGDLGQGVAPVMALLKTHWLAVTPSALPGMAPTYQDIWSFIGRYSTADAPLTLSLPTTGDFRTAGRQTVDGVAVTRIDFNGPMPSAVTADITAAGGTEPPTRLTGSLWIAVDGQHLPVAVQNNAGAHISFSAWNAAVKLATPPRSKVITLDQALATLTH